jgi:hypothetical protein
MLRNVPFAALTNEALKARLFAGVASTPNDRVIV